TTVTATADEAPAEHHERDEHEPSTPKLRRFVTLGITPFMVAIFFPPAAFYMNEWLKNEHSYAGWQITLLQVVTNVPLGGPAIIIGGWVRAQHTRPVIR